MKKLHPLSRLRAWLNKRREKQWAGERYEELPKSDAYTGGRVIHPKKGHEDKS